MTVALFRRKKWNPRRLGSPLAAWYKADAGCYTDAACLFASASSQYLSKSSPTFAPTDKMTIRCSFKPTNLAGSQGLASRWTNPFQFMLFMTNSGRIQLSLRSGAADSITGITADVVMTAGVNAQIVMVYDGTLAEADRVAIYVDGVAKTLTITGTWPATLDTTTVPLVVGSESTGVNFANGALARLGFSSLALSGAALTAAHTSTFWADMTAARQADWFSFFNLCEKDNTRVDSTGLNNLTPTNGPTVAAGPGEGLAVNNSPVKRWEDQSGNARHLLQATIANQPLWIAAAQNGLPVVRFNGTSQYAKTANYSLVQPQDFYIAGRYTTATRAANESLFDGSATNTSRVYRSADNTLAMYAGVAGPTVSPASVSTFHAYRFLFSGASSVASVDNGSDSTGDPSTGNAGLVTIGSSPNPDQYGPVEFGEMLVASAAAPTPASPKAYLLARWGI